MVDRKDLIDYAYFMSRRGKKIINDYTKWDNNMLETLQNSLPEEILNLNLDLKTLCFYYINKINSPLLCNVCGKPLTYSTYSLNDYGQSSKCPECIKNLKRGGRSPFELANQFAAQEQNLKYKDRILKTYDIYYDDNKINNWAKEFQITKKRKPTREDFLEFFGRKFPRKDRGRNIDRSLFSLWDSYLELICIDYLSELGCEEKFIKELCTNDKHFVRNKMFQDNNGKKYQIDIFFPLRNIGFEVNDFTTHSKNSDEEKYEKHQRGFKHGPKYHQKKYEEALKQGIVLTYLWEDEIRDGTFKNKINEVLKKE